MNTDIQNLSSGFQRLYCDATVYDPFSTFHPISFRRVLPFQSQDPVADDERLIGAEEAHLADRNDMTRREVVEAYFRCGLLPEEEAVNLKSVIDYFDAGFFELMGQVYANAGMFICALRWYREFIAELEAPRPDSHSGMDDEDVHASVGYCLYSLGLFAEAISWSKSCIGPDQITDVVCQALMGYEAQAAGGRILAIERAAGRTRYTVSALDPAHASQTDQRLKAAMETYNPNPFSKVYIDWASTDRPVPGIPPEGYPFKYDADVSSLLRHKMNLIFATCGQADALVESGHIAEARRLLSEAVLLEPEAGFIRERLKALS
jgi:tetratricopeptide (TPR) repeat protein